MPKKESAVALGDRRKSDRRTTAERRGRNRIEPDRRGGFGRRKEDLATAEALEQTLSEALREAETFGPDDPRLAHALNDLGVFYFRVKKDTEAEPLYQRALEIQEHALGPTHPDLVQTLHNLAALYYAQSRFGDSEALIKRALEIVRQARGRASQP